MFRLKKAGFTYEHSTFTEPKYTFKHALTQEVAYHSLLRGRRRELHERIAHGIEEMFGNRLEEQSSALAHHYSCSGNPEKTVKYLQHAGQQAGQRSVHREAKGGESLTELKLLYRPSEVG